jgi:hypothetical protein
MPSRVPSLLLLTLAIGLPSPGAAELLPFTLPWDDTSDNLTNLAPTLHAPAGRWGRVGVNDAGHYVLAGERIRFFGVNIGAGASFPPPEKAPAVAARLARFGFNVARFHHLENNWTEGLLDYSTGNSRTFHPGRLDRLDRFIAELKEAGVYINLNLLTSRVFRAGDGLPAEVETMDWKEQHILAFFDATSLALHKEHAAALLGHRNPYTGLAYAEDPAIAFVEINNENGLAHQWHDGGLDRLPQVFADGLAARWNAWLQARYPSSAALGEAWEIIDEPEGSNLLANGAFTSGTSGWSFEQHQGAAGTFTTGTFGGQAGARVTTTRAGEGWHIQLNHPGLAVTEGQLYTLRFRARASVPVSLGVGLRQAHAPWGSAGLQSSLALTTAWQDFTYTFFANQSDTNVRVDFTGMGSTLAAYEFALVELRPGGSVGKPGEGVTLEQGNLPALTRGDSLLPAQRRDWFAFLRDLEFAYWTEMERYVKEDLHYAGIVWGTTVMNSTPHAQAIYDAIDAHVYWQHPHFPGAAWSATNWTVGSEPMVNAPDGGAIAKLALEAVEGFPFNVTEYQHSAPNPYSTDAGLFLALYGSLQDWDGLYLFHYGSGSDDWDRGHFNGFFDLDQHSPKLVNAALGSVLFRQFAIAPAREAVTVSFDAERELEVLARHGSAWNVANLSHLGVDPRLALVHRLRMQLDPTAGEALDTAPPAPAGAELASDTGELRWNREQPEAGYVTLDAPAAKVFVGFDAGRSFAYEGLEFDPGATEQGWSTFAAVLLEGSFADLAAAGGRGLLATTGNVRNTGMVWTDATRTSVSNQWGTAPLLTENIPARLRFPDVPPGRLQVWALDVRGDRAASLPVTPAAAGGAEVTLGGALGSLWYEFAVTAETVPGTLPGLRVESRRADRVALSWDADAGSPGLAIEVALDGGAWETAEGLLRSLGDGRTRFTLPGLPEATPLALRLTPRNTAGDGPFATVNTRTRLSYHGWAANTFSPAQLLDPSLSGPWSDPDGDDLPNALEAAFGLDPLQPDPSPLPMPSFEPAAETGLLVRWRVPESLVSPDGPALALRHGDDLLRWTRADGRADAAEDEAFHLALPWSPAAPTLPDADAAALFWQWTVVED